ncbi:hypothetical protein KXD93_15365 [Mucilaginibacter sp. BJC16-A38]|uniref:hypothetical protein n=1 Tax=Mucilaginibacter phenanthrenivorans TaxID=1234842 RepID=UPI002157D6A8|nr:hypothetical protein [Mucilaginibacter phenanthrenivorans]MCR8559035.1 hypothetical protein [Mucilaginibacter phenanthrenivorans]
MKDLTFWIVFVALVALVWFFDKKYYMLRDNSTALPRPFSFSRVQLAWWTVIIITSFVSIMISRGASPTFDPSTLYLLGISSATTVGATLIDINDQTNPNLTGLSQDVHGNNLFLDILSDKNGIDVHRFQTVAFNLVFGIWFIIYVNNHISDPKTAIDTIMPVVSGNNLILLGVSSGLYAALKSTENKQATADPNQAEIVKDEAKTLG